jgi:hypothetical protein
MHAQWAGTPALYNFVFNLSKGGFEEAVSELM